MKPVIGTGKAKLNKSISMFYDSADEFESI